MKIAVATMDGSSVSQHFGQSTGFIIYEIKENQIAGKKLATAAQTPHESICGHGEEHSAQPQVNLFDLLEGCDRLICGGMGAGAAQNLQAHGIAPVVLPGIPSADQAVEAVLGGTAASSGPLCNCHH